MPLPPIPENADIFEEYSSRITFENDIQEFIEYTSIEDAQNDIKIGDKVEAYRAYTTPDDGQIIVTADYIEQDGETGLTHGDHLDRATYSDTSSPNTLFIYTDDSRNDLAAENTDLIYRAIEEF
jgi:hypothetical protein